MHDGLLWNSAAGLIRTTGCMFLFATLVLALCVLFTILHRLFFHPLCRIPGPKIAAITNSWYAYQVRNGRTVTLGCELHRKYGSIVRVGPSELWFDTREAFDKIYSSTKGYEKSEFYLATSLINPRIDWLLRAHFGDSLDLLSERDVKRYRLQRRLIGRVYQTSNILKFEEAIDSVMKQVVTTIEALNGAEIDLGEWMHIIAVECLGASVLSWSPGLLKAGTDWGSSAHSYLGWRRKSVMGLFPTLSKLALRSRTVDCVYRDIWGLKYTAPPTFKSFFPDISRRISRRIKTALRQTKPRETQRDLLADLIQLHRDKPEFTETYLRKMAVTNFGAGHETMASTLTCIFARICTHYDVRKEVIEEIRGTKNPGVYSNASQLKYTRAAAREAMRLHPVLSMSLPRRVPADGLHLHGHFIPGGTTVGCNPVALHRNQEIVSGPDPEEYFPGRWLEADNESVRTMEKYSLNWGGGSRTCPGKNLAEMIVLKVVPTLFERFDVEVTMPPEVGTPSYFLSMMTGVKAKFIRADSKDGHIGAMPSDAVS